MTAFVACCSHRPRLFCALGLLFTVACAFGHPALAADPMPVSAVGGPVVVHVDQAQVLKLPERTATLVVGNPLIADAAVQPGGIIVITAKSYGVTNLVALDRAGATLMEHTIQVRGPVDNVVVLYRGIEREILQLHAELPAAHHAWRYHGVFQFDFDPDRQPQFAGSGRAAKVA